MVNFNAVEWARIAKAAGMKYMLLDPKLKQIAEAIAST
jgi:hypothetical protein